MSEYLEMLEMHPEMKSLDELQQLAKYKRRWRGAGSQNTEFSVAGCLKPKILNPWQQERTMAPDRSLKAPPGSKPMYIPRVGRDFGFPSTEGVSRRFKKTLAKNMEKYKDYVMNPSKYQKPEKLPSILHPRGFTPSGTGIGDFRFTTTHMLPKSYSQTV